MGHLTWGDIVAILGSIASIIAGLRWLLGVYFRQQIKINAAQKLAFGAQAELLKQEVNALKGVIRLHREELCNVVRNSEKALKQFSDSKEAAQRVYQSLQEFVAITYKRFEKIENGNELQKEVKVKDEPALNVGKVIVKK